MKKLTLKLRVPLHRTTCQVWVIFLFLLRNVSENWMQIYNVEDTYSPWIQGDAVAIDQVVDLISGKQGVDLDTPIELGGHTIRPEVIIITLGFNRSDFEEALMNFYANILEVVVEDC